MNLVCSSNPAPRRLHTCLAILVEMANFWQVQRSLQLGAFAARQCSIIRATVLQWQFHLLQPHPQMRLGPHKVTVIQLGALQS